MPDKIKQLITILNDRSAREDERHDAAIDMGYYNDSRALEALLKIVINPYEDLIILDACGESIAQIWVKRNVFDTEIYKKLQPIAQHTAEVYIKKNKPEWIHLL